MAGFETHEGLLLEVKCLHIEIRRKPGPSRHVRLRMIVVVHQLITCADLPFGFHCVNFRSNKIGTDYGEKVIIKKFAELNDPDIDTTLFDRVHFPKEIYVDSNRIIQWKE